MNVRMNECDGDIFSAKRLVDQRCVLVYEQVGRGKYKEFWGSTKGQRRDKEAWSRGRLDASAISRHKEQT